MSIFDYAEIELVDPDGVVRGGYYVPAEMAEIVLEFLNDEDILYIDPKKGFVRHES